MTKSEILELAATNNTATTNGIRIKKMTSSPKNMIRYFCAPNKCVVQINVLKENIMKINKGVVQIRMLKENIMKLNKCVAHLKMLEGKS